MRDLATTEGLPSQLGRFEITGEIDCFPSTGKVRWFTALDKQLDRAIWIATLTDPGSSFDERQIHKPKSFRLRFIEEGSSPTCRWFAFVAPEGIPILECTQRGTQFPWPITRSLLGEIAELFDTSSNSNRYSASTRDVQFEALKSIDARQLWVDPAGRLSQVDVCVSPESDANIILLVSKLGLPPRHRLRKKAGFSVGAGSLLPIESVPPLSGIRLLEQIGSRANAPSSAELRSMLDKVDKQSHELTPSSRFVSATASLGLLSPMMFLAIIMLVIPSVILIADGLYKEIRRLKSLAVYVEQARQFPDFWKFATEEQKSYWSDPKNQLDIQEALAVQTNRMAVALDRVGSLERMILTSIPNLNLESPPIYGSKRVEGPPKEQEGSRENDAQERKSEDLTTITAGPMNVVEVTFGQELMDSELVQNILGSVERSKQLPKAKESIPDFLIVSVGIAICFLWTACTFGGITKHFTGICYLQRDGRSLGIVRSLWCAMLLYAPVLLLVYAISYCNQMGYDYLGWGTIGKRIFIAIPLAYLVTTLIWYRRTPLDVLSGTVAVPR